MPTIEILPATQFRVLTPAEMAAARPELSGGYDREGYLGFRCLCGKGLEFGGVDDDNVLMGEIVARDGALNGIECPDCRRAYTVTLSVLEPSDAG